MITYLRLKNKIKYRDSQVEKVNILVCKYLCNAWRSTKGPQI